LFGVRLSVVRRISDNDDRVARDISERCERGFENIGMRLN
jgi:hypothetical protein